MKKLILTLVCLLAFNFGSFADTVADQLQQVSVTVHAPGGQGSGTIVTRNGQTYVWTAAHVVSAARNVRKVADSSTGTVKYIVTFDSVFVVKEYVEDGRSVGMVKLEADVIRYSDADFGEDLALLKVKKSGFLSGSAKFYSTATIPVVGTELYHVGSLLGQVGSNSVTTGVYSQVGRVLFGVTFDQVSVTAFHGSSGGGVFLKDGQYVGMLVRGIGEGFHFIIPVRRMNAWAKRVGVEWAMDPTLPVNEKGPVEVASESEEL